VETAKTEVSKCRRLLAEAEDRAMEAEQTAEDYARQRPVREQALFEKIKLQVLDRRQLDSYHESLAALAAKEAELFVMAGKAREAARQAEQNLHTAVEAHKRTLRDLKKFEEHRHIWQTMENARLEAIQEQEAEEIAGIMAMRRRGERTP
jgi:hypothetical protein